jgi:hypothetical protein
MLYDPNDTYVRLWPIATQRGCPLLRQLVEVDRKRFAQPEKANRMQQHRSGSCCRGMRAGCSTDKEPQTQGCHGDLLSSPQKNNHPGCSAARRITFMCDYSLHYVANRPAKVGDKLVTTRFRESYTRGFAAVGEPNVAVCLLPGTEIAFDREVECDRGFGLLRRRRIEAKVARFRQINQDRRTSHRDALEFPDGEVVLLTSLWEGQHATVLQLPASPNRSEAEVQTRASVNNELALSDWTVR